MKTGKFGTRIGRYTEEIGRYVSENCRDIKADGRKYAFCSWNRIKDAIDSGIMVSAYVWSRSYVKGAHYLNIIGWREYPGIGKYIRVIDQWDRSTDHLIRFDFLERLHITGISEIELKKNDRCD